MLILTFVIMALSFISTICSHKLWLRIVSGIVLILFVGICYSMCEIHARVAWNAHQTSYYNRPAQVMIYKLRQKAQCPTNQIMI